MELLMNQDLRLDRIEGKIDKLTDAMIQFAKAEQRIVSVEKAQATSHERMNKHSESLDLIRDQQIKNTHTLQVIIFVVGIIFTTFAGVITNMFIG